MKHVNDAGSRSSLSFARATHMAAFAAAMLLCCGEALGQDSGTKPPEDPVLRGPEVKDNSVPGNKGKFSGNAGARERRGDQNLSPRAMMQAVEVLKKDSTPQADRLTEEQERTLRDVQNEFRKSQKEFFEQHRSELIELRGKLGPEAQRKVDERLRAIPGFGERPQGPEKGKKGEKGGKGPKKSKGSDDAMSDQSESMDGMSKASEADQAAALARLRELAAMSPDPKDAQTKAWAVLSDSQKKLVEAEMQRMAKERRPAGPDAGADRLPKDVVGADGKIDVSKLPPEMRERLEKMPAEQREKALERLAERLKNRK
ncbi:MAG TPA: hypothetical protein VK176_13430 [Phycisphaerales bacterium]|nr:hypothetical protein [Phycisphaerales bacterium]